MWTNRVLITITFWSCGFATANLASDEVFSENVRPIGYPSEDEILEFLINRNQEAADGKWNEYVGDVDGNGQWGMDYHEEGDSGKQTDMRNEETEKQQGKSIRKREGQEEFATFVDPSQSRSYSKSQYSHGIEYGKRARVESFGSISDRNAGDTAFIVTTAVGTVAAAFGVVAAVFVFRSVYKRRLASQECEYPNYGVTGPTKERSGGTSPVAAMDAKLASSAHLYHYQHTKQQIIAMEQSACESKGHESDDSEGEEDEGDFSVYEYPGLAPTGDIEVSNPLFENMGSPLTKTDPKIQPGVHHRFQPKED